MSWNDWTIHQEYLQIMGIPATRATCKLCATSQTFYGTKTIMRADQWGAQHICGVVVTTPRAGFADE